MAATVVFRQENPERFAELWQAYVAARGTSPRYLLRNIDVLLAIARDRGRVVADKSFVSCENNAPVAICFLPIEEADGQRQVTVGGGNALAPVCDNERVEAAVFALVHDVARAERVAKVQFWVDPLENTASGNRLQVYGFLDTSIVATLVPVGDVDDIFRACRENHRRSIKRIRDDQAFEVFVMDSSAPDYGIHEQYRELHRLCAGTVTRPKETFDAQFENLKDGHAFLTGLRLKGDLIAAVYFDIHGTKGVYVSGADDPAHADLPLYHILHLTALQYAKDHGVSQVDLGQPACPSAQWGFYPDDKQKNIAHYKKGFGAVCTSQYQGVKYVSRAAFEKDVNAFGTAYRETIAI